MPDHVLVPIDGSEQADAALEYALVSFPDATFSVVFVVDPAHDHEASVGGSDTAFDRTKARGKRILERANARAEDRGLEITTELRTGRPHTEILEVATRVDHVVLGTHGRSPITSPFLGRVSEAVIRRSPVSTTVVPEPVDAVRAREFPGRILVPLDGSEQADAALEYALETFPESELTVLHALSLPFDRPRADVEGTYLEAILDDREARAETIFEDAREIATERGVTIETAVENESPARATLDHAETNDFDQIVMGTHGRSLPARLIIGSVAERVTRRSSRTITLVRGRPTEPST